MGSALMSIEGLFLLLAAIQAQVIVKGIRRSETTTIKTVRKRRSCVIKLCKVECLQQRVGKLLNEPSYGRQNQSGAPNDRFRGNIRSEPSRMAKIFGSPRTAKNFENVSW